MQRETGLHWAAFGGHADIVDLLLRANAPVNIKDQRFDGTPLGWALYGWSKPAPESKNTRYYDVVDLLVRAGAIVDREWQDSPNRGSCLGAKLRADPRMRAALGVED
jgi:ankyrin repeat protein